MISILAVLFTFSVVIFFHELGHFLVAKKFGVWVKTFSLGFGPELLGKTIKNTRYRLSLIPLGGYVKMAGEDPGEKREGVKSEFLSQSWGKRMLIVLAGPVMNFLLAITIFSLVFYIWGKPQIVKEPIIGEVVEGFSAQEAGIKEGDRIISIDGREVNDWEEVVEIVHPSKGKTLHINILRGNEEIEFLVASRIDPERDISLIGITAKVEMKKIGLLSSFFEGTKQTIMWIGFVLKSIGLMFSRIGRANISGPLGIGQMVAEVSKTGWENFLSLIALISLNIGLFNLFPIPILDGGQMVFYLWEGFTGKPLSEKKIRIAQMVGLSILMVIFVFAMQCDISRWRNGWGN
ncbi:RIP metalloprotease RseP [bacterium]|nr:RIP metalloprotease RseP [bacterium]